MDHGKSNLGHPALPRMDQVGQSQSQSQKASRRSLLAAGATTRLPSTTKIRSTTTALTLRTNTMTNMAAEQHTEMTMRVESQILAQTWMTRGTPTTS